MQWSISGSVNWTAARAVALAFMPVMATIVFLAVVLPSLMLTPRAGQENLTIPAVLFVAAISIGAQALHFARIQKALRRKDG